EDAPLICVVRRNAVRRSLGARVLLLWRLAYEDADGRVAESALVALAVALSGGAGFDARHADWSDASLISIVGQQGAAWHTAVEDAVRRSAATRMARERAIAATRATRTNGFQA